ncbi:hypothetical protein BsWGS_19304 [Bradybaena similaris]
MLHRLTQVKYGIKRRNAT